MRRFLFFILAFILSSAALAKINRIYEPILVSQSLTLSPHRLCHNGLFLSFKNKVECERARVPNFDCEQFFHIAPIRSTEEIFLTSDPSSYVTRFYHIDLRYRYQEVDTVNDILLVDEPRTVSACENQPIYVTENVTQRRPVQNQEEQILIASLLDQANRSNNENYLILNTPIGSVGQAEVLTAEDLGKSDAELNLAKMKTPFCSDYGVDQIWKLSGEYTGSGVRSLHPARLQTISRPLYVKAKRWVINEETGEMELRYEFTCEKVWEI